VALPVQPELAWAAGEFRQAGVDEPRREAARIWAGLAGTTPGAVLLSRDTTAAPARVDAFRDAVRRRIGGEPLAYVTGTAGFRRLTLLADRRALIPRPETEGLVDVALAVAPRGRALDLGTGGGCIALALADEGDYFDVTGVDRVPATLALAAENGAATGIAVRWLLGEWTTPVAGERFDLVVSNPPYLTCRELRELDPSVRDWEPHTALESGADGLQDVGQLLRDVPAVLADGGWLVMEVDSARASAAAVLALRAGWTTVRMQDDLFGRPRYLVARRERADV
jgi:release factor glutamine methyltransferase